MTTTEPTTQTQHILQRSVCLVLACSYLGNHRRVEVASLEIEKGGEKLAVGATDELGATKRLFANKDLAPGFAAVASVKNRLRAISVRGAERMFGDGAYLIPLLAVPEANVILAEGAALCAKVGEELALQRDQLVEQRRAKLGTLFDETEFPTADRMRHAFHVRGRYVSFGAPEQLMEVDAAAYEKARADHEALLADAYQDVILGLRESAALVLQELAERLRPDEDGKPRALRPTALRDLQDLLERLPVLNSIGEDGDLAKALAKVGVMAQGLDVETLRKAPQVRAMLLATAETVAGELDGLVLKGRRAMLLPVAS